MNYGDLNEKQKEDYNIIAESQFFDCEYYKFNYELSCNDDPIVHFVEIGVDKGYNPSPDFDTKFYLRQYGDVRNSGMNPFVHYLKYGITEHRIPKLLDICQIKKLKLSEGNVLDYLIIKEFGEFNHDFYIKNYNLDNFDDPIVHFVEIGVDKGYNPSPDFDTKFYLRQYGDVRNSGMNPFVHYLKYGKKERRIPKSLEISLNNLLNSNLKKTFRGYEDYYFLINDSNCELRQHFDETYLSRFDSKKFNNQISLKKCYLSRNNIDYYLFLVPDRSIVCKEFLPFEFNNVKRNVESIEDIIDFTNNLSPNEFFKYDTHINYEGGKLLSFCFINYIDSSFSREIFEKLIDNGKKIIRSHKYDFLLDSNWSYSDDERNIIGITHKEELVIPKNLENLKNDIPNKFLFCKNRETNYFRNPDSFSDLKVLIFHDSCTLFIKDYLSFYFKEMLLYWDHGSFNREIIEWYNPDLILEIRLERFLENLPIPQWIFNENL